MLSNKARLALFDIRENGELACEFIAGLTYEQFERDRRTFYAVTRALEIISEAARRLPRELHAKHPHLPWRAWPSSRCGERFARVFPDCLLRSPKKSRGSRANNARCAARGGERGAADTQPREDKGRHMVRRFIDISAPLQNDVPADPPGLGPKIEYIDHRQSLPQILPFFPGLRQEDLPDGQGWAVERVQLTTHNGTHLDAPWHYHPTMNEGERAWTIDEVPLEWCFQPGVKLDFRHFPDGYVATAADVDQELKRIDYKLKPLDIVLVNTSAGAKYGRPDYVASGCGIGAEATLHLLKQGVRVTGTDGWSWDAPFIHTAKRYAETHDASLIWEGHKAGRHIGYCHIEKLHNLEALPSTGFMVCASRPRSSAPRRVGRGRWRSSSRERPAGRSGAGEGVGGSDRPGQSVGQRLHDMVRQH